MLAVAVDGPAGAGKSSLARAAAHSLGCLYIDTGALYRAVALYTLRQSADPCSAAAVEPLLAGIALTLRHNGGTQQVFLGDEDVSEEIRRPEVSAAASKVAAHPCVRTFLLGLQRQLASEQDVIMDGRDIGTVVLPDAQVKIFLTASPEERARRRMLELQEKGTSVSFEQVLAEIHNRDYQDTYRAAAPLRQADDAILLDTSALTFEEALAQLLHLIRQGGQP